MTSKFDCFEGPLGVTPRTSWETPESASQERNLNARLRRPLDVILGRPEDFRSGRPQYGQIGSLADVLGMSWGPVFADWVSCANLQ